MNNRLKYVKHCRRRIEAAELSTNEMPMNDSTEMEPPNPVRDLEDLKTDIIHRCSRDELIRKLNSTRDARKVLMLRKETDLRHQFPYFFAEPKLVSNTYV